MLGFTSQYKCNPVTNNVLEVNDRTSKTAIQSQYLPHYVTPDEIEAFKVSII